MTDGELISRFVKSRDEAAFAELITRYRGFIRRTIFGVFGSWPEEAEETEQDVMIALAEGLRNFRHTAAFSTYLYRLTRNRGIDRLRSLRRRRARFVSPVPDIADTLSPEQHSMNSEDLHFLYYVLRRLKEEERSIILLKEIEGFSLKDVAEFLAIPDGTAKSRLHRARNKMLKIGKRIAGIEVVDYEMPRMEKNTKRA